MAQRHLGNVRGKSASGGFLGFEGQGYREDVLARSACFAVGEMPGAATRMSAYVIGVVVAAYAPARTVWGYGVVLDKTRCSAKSWASSQDLVCVDGEISVEAGLFG